MTPSEIATKAANTKKPNKARAFDLLTKLVKDPAQADTLLPELYAFFMPSKSSKPNNLPEFAVKFINKKDIRKYLQYIYIKGGRATATDGHRLLQFPVSLPDGFYDMALNILDIDPGTYPDASRVIPDIAEMLPFSIPADLHGLTVAPMEKGSGFTVSLAGVLVDQKYLLDAVSLTKRKEVMIYLSKDMHGQPTNLPIRVELLDYPEATIVIMPLRS